jgi:hypothetical protein
MSENNPALPPKKRYLITITDSNNPELGTYICDWDEVYIRESRNVTPIFKAGSDKALALVPSAKTLLSISGVRIDHSVNPDGVHTMLDPIPMSKEELGVLMNSGGACSVEELNKMAQPSKEKSLARIKKSRKASKGLRR